MLILAFEGLLRLTVSVKDYPLFVPASEKSDVWQPNPDLIKRYFHHPDLAPNVSPDTQLFTLQKAPGQVRIVVMGGSTAAGFPYGRFGSLSGMLQQRVKRLYPDKDIEVLSVAISSINTYTLIDIVDEVLAIEPDAVLIYTGHNEFLGVMGVGSSYASYGSAWLTRAFLFFRDWRLFQLMQSVLISAPDSRAQGVSDHTVMASIAKHKHIEFGSEMYQKGVEQFENNLNYLIGKIADNDVKTFVATIASNDTGQPPFSGNTLDNPTLASCMTGRLLDKAVSSALVKQYADSANAHFCHARVLEHRGDINTAQQHYTRASDLDGLRFRAPSEFNQVIMQTALQYDAYLVDVHSAMQQASVTGLIGNNLMLEHLHPNKRGYFVLAEAFAQSIANNWLTPSISLEASRQIAWQEVPLTEADELYAQFKINQLTNDYPFKDTPTTVTFDDKYTFAGDITWRRIQGEPWLDLQQSQLKGYQRQQRWTEAARVAGILYDALPFESQTANASASLHLRAEKPKLAAWYARRAVQLQPDNIDSRLTLAEALFKSAERDQAIAQLEHILTIEPDNRRASYFLSQLKGVK